MFELFFGVVIVLIFSYWEESKKEAEDDIFVP
jgi:hypothetical protein